MAAPACVGALVLDSRHRVFAQRRSPYRRLLPGIWDVVGGHLEAGESPEQALARELTEETGWKLAHIEALIADWEWEWDGVVRRELDYLVTVTGDLAAPRLEEGKHDEYAWVGPDNLDLMMVGRTDNDRRLRDIVAKAVRIRLSDRLRLEPVDPAHVDDLVRLHDDPAVAFWYAGRWDRDEALRNAARMGEAWEVDGVCTWMAYERTGREPHHCQPDHCQPDHCLPDHCEPDDRALARGALVGRGGLSRMAPDADVTHRIETALGDRGRAWARDRLELGWAILSSASGRGLATELGRAGLTYAFDTVGADEVVAFTERHNTRSRAVMERLGMDYVGEILGEGLVERADGVHEGAPFALYATGRAQAAGPSPVTHRK